MQIFSYLKNQFRHTSEKKVIKKKINVGVKLSKISMLKKLHKIFLNKVNLIK